jgi:small subunit ribosomal protein S6
MKNYETVFIVRQDATPGQVETLAQSYAEVIRAHGGEVGKTEFCGLRNLAYRIKKGKKAHYVLMNLSATPAGITEMERQMKLSEDVMRYLTTSAETLDNNPSSLMQQRGFREDRYRSYDDDFGDREEGFDAPSLAPSLEPIVA